MISSLPASPTANLQALNVGRANPVLTDSGIRTTSIDLLKCAMAVFVIGLHTAAFSGFGTWANWLTGNGLFRIAVPCFFVINGFYFARVKEFAQWARRIIKLHLFWLAVYLPYWCLNYFTVEAKLAAPFLGIMHLWYLPALFVAGCLTFTLQPFDKKWMVGAAAVLFAACMLFTYLGQIHPDAASGIWKQLHSPFLARNGLVFGFPFFAIGFLISREDLAHRLSIGACMAGLVGGLALLLIESAAIHTSAPARPSIDVLASLIIVAPFLVLATMKIKLGGPGKLFSKISSGMFFIHFWPYLALRSAGIQGLPMFAATLASTLLITLAVIHFGKDRFAVL